MENGAEVLQQELQWKELEFGVWEEPIKSLLLTGEKVDFGNVKGEYLDVGTNGEKSQKYTGIVGKCNSDTATSIDTPLVARIIEAHNPGEKELPTIEGVYEVQ